MRNPAPVGRWFTPLYKKSHYLQCFIVTFIVPNWCRMACQLPLLTMAKKHQKIDDLSLSELQPTTERLKVQSLTTFLANTIEFYDLFNMFQP